MVARSSPEGLSHAPIQRESRSAATIRKTIQSLTVATAFWMSSTLERNLAQADTPETTIMEDRVDLVEVNHYFDEQGRHVFDQTIFYDWCDETARYQIRDFRLLKSSGQMPVKDQNQGEYESLWHDGSTLRKVRAASFRESWTQYDPELAERDHLPKDQRRELSKLPPTPHPPTEEPPRPLQNPPSDEIEKTARRIIGYVYDLRNFLNR